jgi:hypothetical protein
VVKLYDMDDLLIKFMCYPRISGSKRIHDFVRPTCILCFRDHLPKKLSEVRQVIAQELAPKDEIFSCVVCGKLAAE